MSLILSGLAEVASQYDALFCDVWGVLHNGQAAFPQAIEALSRFRGQGKTVVLLTNAPVPSRLVEMQFGRLGVPAMAYDAIISSGDVVISLLNERADLGVFPIGPPDETGLFSEVLALHGQAPRLVPLNEAQFVLCIGLSDPWRQTPEDYDAVLAAMRIRNLDLICANPDIVVEEGARLYYCAGAIAERYERAGGKVIQAGKPHAPIYERALALVQDHRVGETLPRSRILVVGDAMATDIKGAHWQGLDSLFVTSGIHRGELHGGTEAAALDAAAYRQFLEAKDFVPKAAIPALVW
ncbi:MAG TPA: TIGR01459 family HAD-type hydrolase [Methylocella sp.]|nr:TIGR01459 family HAD-type hydrolase [Methylocella sp.]